MNYLQQFNELSLAIKFLTFFILIGIAFLYSLLFYVFSKKFNFKKKSYKISFVVSLIIILVSVVLELISSSFFDVSIMFYRILIGGVIFLISFFIFMRIYNEGWKNSLITLILSNIIFAFAGAILFAVIKMIALMNFIKY